MSIGLALGVDAVGEDLGAFQAVGEEVAGCLVDGDVGGAVGLAVGDDTAKAVVDEAGEAAERVA